MATISIDKTEYPTLKDCAVGEKLDLDGEVTSVDGDTLTIDVSDVSYADVEGDTEDAAPEVNPVSKIGVPGKKKVYA